MSKEILSVIESVSLEKGVPKEVIFGAMEAALAVATKKKYGEDAEFRVAIDRDTGEYETYRTWDVVDFDNLEEEEPNPGAQYSVEEAREIKADAQLGDVLEEQVESVEFGRIAAQTAKQVIVQKVREAERAQIVEVYESRINELLSGTVKKLGRDSVIVDLGNNAEAILTREHLIPREVFRVGDRLRAMLVEIRPDNRGPQLILSRTAPSMLIELFKVEVPEIAEDVIQILGAARDPGSRAKIAVQTNDGRIDPVGACVGMRGSRVQAVSGELAGERIDIVPWIDEPQIFIERALSPANVSRVITDNRRKHAVVLVDEDQLSLAIGKSGQNSRLASQLTGWGMDLITESQYQERRAKQEGIQELLRKIPGVSELIALSLTTSGFDSIRSVSEATIDLLRTVPGLEEEDAARGRLP